MGPQSSISIHSLKQKAHHILLLAKDSKGGVLLEAAIVLMVLGTAGTAVLAGLSTTHRSGAVVEDQSEAENIARNQLESVVSQSYLAPPAPYSTVTVPAGYSVSVSNAEYTPGNSNLALITVSVSHGADLLVSVESLRSNQ